MPKGQYTRNQRKLAALAEPRDKITRADVIAGAKMKAKKKTKKKKKTAVV
jgi:hypothetical protein